MIYSNLLENDQEVSRLISLERLRELETIELLNFQNYTSLAVMDAYGSGVTNKYSSGQPENRYYGATEFIDKIEILCKNRALLLFNLNSEVWDVNVQLLSIKNANLATFIALSRKNGKILHLIVHQGEFLVESKPNFTLKEMFDWNTSRIRVDTKNFKRELEEVISNIKPKVIKLDVLSSLEEKVLEEIKIASKGAFIMIDISNIDGYIATGFLKMSFEIFDVITTIADNLLRGPKCALIFFKRKVVRNCTCIDLKKLIDSAVYPGIQGGPNNQKIAALAVAIKQALSAEYKDYIKQIFRFMQVLKKSCEKNNFNIVLYNNAFHRIGIATDKSFVLLTAKGLEVLNILVETDSFKSSYSHKETAFIVISIQSLATRLKDENDYYFAAQILIQSLKLLNELIIEYKNTFNLVPDINGFLPFVKSHFKIIRMKKKVSRFAQGLKNIPSCTHDI